jgi:hypothetical protein
MSEHGTWRRLKRFAKDGSERDDGEMVRFEDARKLIEHLEDELQESEWELMGDDL